MEGGVSEYPSLPTVLSGNVSNAAVSVNEVKRMDRCPRSSPPHLSGPIQSPHPIVLVQLLRFEAGALLCAQHPAPGRRSSAENKDAANSFPLLRAAFPIPPSLPFSRCVCSSWPGWKRVTVRLGPLIICQKS